MDSSNGSANYKLEAIKKAIADGTLTKEEISRRLAYAIHMETDKQPDEQDTDFVMACQTILYEMRTGHSYVSRKEESKRELKNRLSEEAQRNKPPLRVFTRSLLAAGVLIVVLIGTDILFSREWLDGESTEDQQQYVISGQKIDPGIVDEGQADESVTEPQSITTTNLDEAVEVLGFTPAMPQWIPDGWELLSYDVFKTELSNWFTATYSNAIQEYALIYHIAYYGDIEQAQVVFEQSRSGEEYVLDDGSTVYITENLDDTTCVWYENSACYNLAGPEDVNTFIKIIQSIKESP